MTDCSQTNRRAKAGRLRMIQSALTKPDRVARPSVSHRTARGGKSHVSDATLKAALRAHAGNLSQAAQECGVARQSLWERVRRSADLQAFIANLDQEINDLAESKVIEAIQAGDMTTVRWRLTQKARDRGYGIHAEQEVFTPPDPEAESRRLEALAFFGAEIERRARAGLPGLFSGQGALPKPELVQQEPIDVTPRKPNGSNGVG